MEQSTELSLIKTRSRALGTNDRQRTATTTQELLQNNFVNVLEACYIVMLMKLHYYCFQTKQKIYIVFNLGQPVV